MAIYCNHIKSDTSAPISPSRAYAQNLSRTMALTHTKEAYEALLKRVKALEEENKHLRNVRTTSEVKLQPKRRDRKATRSSLSGMYNEATALRKHKMLLGQEVKADDVLVWRVKWGQRGAGVSALLAVIFYFALQYLVTVVFSTLTIMFLGTIYYKNHSFVITKTIVARDERGDYSRLKSVCFGDRYCATHHSLSLVQWIFICARSIRFCIVGRHKSEKSGVWDSYWDFICISDHQ